MSEYEVIFKVQKENERKLVDFLQAIYPDLKEEQNKGDLDRYIRFALGDKGLIFPADDMNAAVARYNQLKDLGFGEVSTKPPIVDATFEELKPEPSITEQEPISQQEEIDALLKKGMATEESKPEMAEITVLSCGEGRFAEAVAVLIEFMLPTEAGALLGKLDAGEKQIIQVPKLQKAEALEKFLDAGLIIEVSEQVEEVIASSVSKKQLDEIAAQLVALQELVKGIKVPAQDTAFVAELKRDIRDLSEMILKNQLWLIGGEKDGKFEPGIVVKRFEEIKNQIAEIKIPAPQDLSSILDKIGEIEFPEPKMVDLDPVIAQIKGVFSEANEVNQKVEEIKFEILGGTADDGSTVVGLKGQLATGFAAGANAEKSAKSAKRWAVSAFVVGLIVLGWLFVSFLRPTPPVKIDTKAIQAAVQAAMPAEQGISVTNTPTAAQIVAEMKKQGLVAPAATIKAPATTETGTTETTTTTTTSGRRGKKF